MQAHSFFNARMTNLAILCWLMAKSEEYVAKLIESIAIIKVVIRVKRAELMSLHKTTMNHLKHVQPVFVAKQKLVISQQSVSVFVEKKCTDLYGRSVKDVMLAGVDDDDIRREILSTKMFCLGHRLT